ncbi:hypothetical protein, partial [Escherichia coli]|uniref:hypothetical protein n=1 Tax=Escherichia coli TaxID=562 RepID=UPI003CE52771
IELAELAHGQRRAVHGIHGLAPRLGRPEIDEGDDQGGQGRCTKASNKRPWNGKALGGLVAGRSWHAVEFLAEMDEGIRQGL